MNEEWIKLTKYNIPEDEFVVTNYIDNIEGTKIILENDDYLVEVFFDGLTLFTRIGLEGLMMRTWSEVQLKYEDRFFFKNWFLYQVLNSRLINWAIEESYGFYQELEIFHYSIVTTNEVMDILSTFEPTVKVVNNK